MEADWLCDAPLVLLQTSTKFTASRQLNLASASKLLLSSVAISLLGGLLWIVVVGAPKRQSAPRQDGMSNFTLLLLTLTMGLDFYSTDQYQSSMPSMAIEFGVSQAAMGMSIIVHSVVLSCALLVAGPLSDVLGRRPLVLLCQFVLVTSSLCCAFSDTFAWFMVGRAFQGISAAVYSVILAVVRDCCDDETQRLSYTGLVISMAVVGPLVAPMLGGIFASFFGWRSCFYSVALASFLLFVVSFRRLEETAPESSGGSYCGSLHRVLFHGRRMLILVAMGICKSFFDIIAAASNFILQWQHQFNMTQASFLSTFIAVSGACGVLISSYSGKSPAEVFWSFWSPVMLSAFVCILAGLQEDNEVLFLSSLCFATMVLYPPYLALLADLTTDLQDMAGLAAAVGTSVAQFMSFALSIPGMQLASLGATHMMVAIAALLATSQLLCLALCHGALAWKVEARG